VLTTAVAVKDHAGCRLAMLLRRIPTRQFTVVTYSGAPDNRRVCPARAVHGSESLPAASARISIPDDGVLNQAFGKKGFSAVSSGLV
jgi:hypothetical protein